MGKATKTITINEGSAYVSSSLRAHKIRDVKFLDGSTPWSLKHVIDGVSLSENLVNLYKLIRKTYPTLLIEPYETATRMDVVGDMAVLMAKYVYKIAIRYAGSPCHLAIITHLEGDKRKKSWFTLSSPAINTPTRITRKAPLEFIRCTRRFTSEVALVRSIKDLGDISIPRVLHTHMLNNRDKFQGFVDSEKLKLSSEYRLFGKAVRGDSSNASPWTQTLAFIEDTVSKVGRGQANSIVIPPHIQEAYKKYCTEVVSITGTVDAEANKHVVMVATLQGTSKVYCTYLDISPPYRTVSYDSIEQLPYLIQRKLHTLAESASTTLARVDHQQDGVGIRMRTDDYRDEITTELYAVGVDGETISTLVQRAVAQKAIAGGADA